MNPTFLQDIYEATQQRKNRGSLEDLRQRALSARRPYGFVDIFSPSVTSPQRAQPCIIAEVKFARPGKGMIAHSFDPVEVSSGYLANGAAAISVLTEPTYFKGSLRFLRDIRQKHPAAKLLMNDFIFEEYQLLEGRIAGADAILLIAALLTFDRLKHLYTQALALQLTPLVEVHTEEELASVLSLGVPLIGVNNRNLKTLTIDLGISERLIKKVPPWVFVMSESGLSQPEEITRLHAAGFHGFLMGSHFMTTPNPGASLGGFLKEVEHGRQR